MQFYLSYFLINIEAFGKCMNLESNIVPGYATPKNAYPSSKGNLYESKNLTISFEKSSTSKIYQYNKELVECSNKIMFALRGP